VCPHPCSTACNLSEHSRPGADSGGIVVYIFIFGGKEGKENRRLQKQIQAAGV